ncbi:hypothetical protein LH128_01869 [Sphingomonas sp. LH128]|uniref:hypothetical protein n=1 Tax=Sphingomonas sp. LH128 TaxID=473781 RepID=UPI00027C96CF|nr:hypothetical protein [Sphingomonas sp. LH128]EJU14811.1 hypothetical protein LH128_01869 [Sphingomonas sp. LH128]
MENSQLRSEAMSAKVLVMLNAIRELADRPDREFAIIAASMIEDLLVDVLKTKLAPLSGDRYKRLFQRAGAPLGTFSARADLAHALGLIDDQILNDLDQIRKIRNAFAHNFSDLSFATGTTIATKEQSDIEKACNALQTLDLERYNHAGVNPNGVGRFEIYETLVEYRPMFLDTEGRIIGQLPAMGTADWSPYRARFSECIQLVWFILAGLALSG